MITIQKGDRTFLVSKETYNTFYKDLGFEIKKQPKKSTNKTSKHSIADDIVENILENASVEKEDEKDVSVETENNE